VPRGTEDVLVHERFKKSPDCQPTAKRYEWLFYESSPHFGPTRFLVEVIVAIERRGWRRGVDVARDGHSGLMRVYARGSAQWSRYLAGESSEAVVKVKQSQRLSADR
jgi:hypothetical protein